MKEKLFKITSAVIVLCILLGTISPSIVNSVQVVVSGMTDTGRGVGSTQVFKNKVNGYSNIYCVRGGATLDVGTQLDDYGLSLYDNIEGIVTNSSALQFVLDNIYLIEETNSTVKSQMKNNLINTVKKYSNYKDSNGDYILSKKLGVSKVDDSFIKTMADELLSDTNTLFAVQQYAIWNFVNNDSSKYNNTLKNSDGSYCSIPGANIDKKYYMAWYITLDELAKEAGKNGYISPNSEANTFEVKLQKQDNASVKVSADETFVLAGPFKLANNHKYVSKSLSVKVNSDSADKVEIINKDAKAISISETQGEFYLKITYNKKFKKGTKYDINVNVDLKGHKTYANLLDSKYIEDQPVGALRTENYSNSTKASISFKEEVKGEYDFVLRKIDDTNPTISLKDVEFSVKEGSNTAKNIKTNFVGAAFVASKKQITSEGTDTYTIKEVNVGNDEYLKINSEIKVYVKKAKQDGGYTVESVSFDPNKQVSSKEVTLQDNTKVKVKLQKSKQTSNDGTTEKTTILLTVPNRKKDTTGSYSVIIQKVDSEDESKTINGVKFTVKEGNSEPKELPATTYQGYASIVNSKEIKEEGIDEYTITEVDTQNLGYVKLKDEIKFYVTKEFVNNKYVATKVSFENANDVLEKEVTLEDGSKVKVKLQLNLGTIKVTVPNKKKIVELPKPLKFVLNKVDEQGKPLIGADFTVEKFVDNTSNTLLNNEEVKGTYEVLEQDAKINKTYLYKVIEVESAPEYVNIMDGKYITIATYLDENKKLQQGVYKNEELPIQVDNNLYKKYGFIIHNTDGSIVKENETDLYNKIIVKISNDSQLPQVTVTIPNEKIVILKGSYNLELLKIDAKTKQELKDASFDITVKKDGKEIKLYDQNEKEINLKGLTTNDMGKLNISNVKILEEAKYNFEIKETKAPEGYEALKEAITFDLETKLEGTDYTAKISNSKGPANVKINNSTINITVENNPIGVFDLALRKFITNVNNKEVNTRIPVFKIDEKGNYVYNHDKEPVLVANSNIVTYTLRVYNEGTIDGYAREIKDNIPQGLEFLPDYELNKEYRWLMLDKNGKETDNADEAKFITSDYLAKEQEKTDGENLLKAFDKEKYESGEIKEPYYKEVKVAFKVNMPDKSNEIIINHAQISDDSDKDGNDVTDIDSTPNEWIDGEDDQDIEKIRIQYFDLALRKWVTKAIVYENGKEVIHETGHKAEDDPEEIVKVDLNKSNINKVSVKFEYKIRIENQGQIAGYAKEISDYIPEGLKFVKEDNPDWREVDGKVVTDKLKDTLLQPGETAEVSILLTWINREDNMGLKVNVAEISKDYNDYGAPDIDSTPNNQVKGEDDIDDAPVMLTVKTGEQATYLLLTASVLAIILTGVVLIKKYVL